MTIPVLAVEDLRVAVQTRDGTPCVVDGVSLSIDRGTTVALVGESGSGKSMTCAAIMRLLPRNARVAGGRVLLAGADITSASEREMQSIRGRRIGMVLQDAMGSLNPLLSIGHQIGEVVEGRSAERRRRILQLLRRVRIPGAEQRLKAYPHQLSGGMRQRVSIAINVARVPELLIADEPTTALDSTVQVQILALLRSLQQESGTALLIVTHDLGLVARFADRVAIMYAGQIVEEGPVARVFAKPLHPYTKGLLAATPRTNAMPERLPAIAGQPPTLREMPAGCRFAPRCPHARPQCEEPPRRQSIDGHGVSCWRMGELS